MDKDKEFGLSSRPFDLHFTVFSQSYGSCHESLNQRG